MNRVIITLSDNDDEDGVNLRVEFDPPLDRDAETVSHAQAEAAFLIEIIKRRAQGQTLQEMANEVNEEEYGTVVSGSYTDDVIYAEPDEPNEPDEGDLS